MAEKRMTVREVADVLAVSPETIRKHIRELFPDLMKNGYATYLTEEHVTQIKQKMEPTTQVVGNLTRLEEDALIARAHEIIVRRAETAEAELRKVKAENKELARSLVTVSGMADWLIAGHQKLGEEALAKYGGLPYWHDH
jgi:DeoR/GlpR family transcriptional regulator of sugar metabolism